MQSEDTPRQDPWPGARLHLQTIMRTPLSGDPVVLDGQGLSELLDSVRELFEKLLFHTPYGMEWSLEYMIELMKAVQWRDDRRWPHFIGRVEASNGRLFACFIAPDGYLVDEYTPGVPGSYAGCRVMTPEDYSEIAANPISVTWLLVELAKTLATLSTAFKTEGHPLANDRADLLAAFVMWAMAMVED